MDGTDSLAAWTAAFVLTPARTTSSGETRGSLVELL
jgi:hypothetical protein